MTQSKILEYARNLRKNQTPAEKLFWTNVRNRRLKGLKFNRQFIIEHESRSYFIADFYCHEHQLIIELDGGIHDFQAEYDKIREDILKSLGYQIVRFKNEEVLEDWMSVDNKLVDVVTLNPSLKKEGKIRQKSKRGEFKNLQLKVCGMGQPENIQGLIDLCPNFMGFIFYKKSPRYKEDLDEEVLRGIPKSISKVGVFVNESADAVLKFSEKYGLEYAQLHGDEEVDFCKELKSKGLKVIKVFRVMDAIPTEIKKYAEVVDYFLFDTKTPDYGGSGKHFDWSILKAYNLETPYLLSGGIRLVDIDEIKRLELKGLAGIDVNSKFEIEPGLKDLRMISELKTQLN